ncbi:hypothetical protein [Brevundimonas sp.]|uniref:hypothetical protein n=1 Tax=Brevundimonas sp. TaxID=1871086 RepID=UPI0026030CE9|nr:hypothetical protein [Brevundimonas sp.]
MVRAFARHHLSMAAVAAIAVLAGCATPEPPPPPPAPPPPPPPPPALALNGGIAEAAAVYVTFIRDVGSIEAGFANPEAIQSAIRKGAAFEPTQLSRGMIAYGAILALQSPEFVAGVRTYAADPAQREQIIGRILADPAYAATLPGADQAAGLIVATLGADIAALTTVAEAVEEDAYKIQERSDPRRRWASTPVADRPARLESAKALSVTRMLPSPEESARLFSAAHSGEGLNLAAGRAAPPYTPVVINALAIAALAALGAGGEEYRAQTDALIVETNSEFCFNMTKLNLFQCLAAARPHYEDIFCVGQHIVRDIAVCTAEGTGPTRAQLTPVPTLAGTPPAQSTAAGAVAAADQAPAPGQS